MKLVNLTSHDVIIYTGDGAIRFKPSGVVASVSYTCTPVFEVDMKGHRVPFVACEYGDIEAPGLKGEEGAAYIVSPEVAEALERGKPHPVLQNHTVVVPLAEGWSSDTYGRAVYARMFRIVKNSAYKEWRLLEHATNP